MILKSVLFFLLLLYLPGLIIFKALAKQKCSVIELFFSQCFFGLLYNNLLMFLLLCLGLFSFLNLNLSKIALILPFAFYIAFKKKFAFHLRSLAKEVLDNYKTYILLFLIIAASIALYQRPSEWVLSEGADGSNYIVQGAYHTQHKSIFLENSQMEAYRDFFANAKFKWNATTGFPLRDDTRREFGLPPLWKMNLTTAILFSGLKLALYVPLFIGLFTAVGFYILLKRITKKELYALIGTFLLSFSPLFILYMRLPLSEIYALYVIIGSLLILYLAIEQKNKLLGVASGIAFSCIFLIRGDAIALYGGLLIFIFLCSFTNSEYFDKHIVRYFGSSFLLTSILFWLVPLYYTSREYLHWHFRKINVTYLNVAMIAIAIIYIFLLYLDSKSQKIKNPFKKIYYNDIPWKIAGIIISVYFFILLYVRQSLPPGYLKRLYQLVTYIPTLSISTNAFWTESILLYMTPLITVLGAVGIIVIIFKRKERYFLILFVFILNVLLYIYFPFHSSILFWASRRYIYNVFPLFTVGAVASLMYFEDKIKKIDLKLTYKTIVVCALLLVLLLHNSRMTFGNFEYIGAADSLKHFANNFQKNDVIMIDGEKRFSDALQLGLKYYYNYEALSPFFNTITDEEFRNFYREMQKENKKLILILDNAKEKERMESLFSMNYRKDQVSYYNELNGERERIDIPINMFRVNDSK
jgi:hypothetical protein